MYSTVEQWESGRQCGVDDAGEGVLHGGRGHERGNAHLVSERGLQAGAESNTADVSDYVPTA